MVICRWLSLKFSENYVDIYSNIVLIFALVQDTIKISIREADNAVDKLQAFYKVNPIERVERTAKTNSEHHTSGQEGKNNLEFQKVLLQYYNSKAIQYQNPVQQPCSTYGKNAAETLYEAASTVNFFG